MNPKILVKSDDQTDPRYGIEPQRRPLEEYIRKGVVDLDKPSGPTSHQVASWVKEMLNLKKAGHSGTLDPKVTGVLPIAFEDSTRILQTLLTAGKGYIALMRVHGEVTDRRLTEVLNYFQGRIFQRPPLKSSVKRQLRIKNIYSIKLIERSDCFILLDVDCEAGTYMRKLCHDLGLVLGTGAHMRELRRIRSGPFTEENAVTLHDLKDAYEFYLEDGDERHLRECILPMEHGVQHLKKIWIKDTAVSAVCHGADLNAPGVSRLDEDITLNELVAVMSLKNELVATGRSLRTSEEIHEMGRGKVVDLERVVMEPDIYPRKWHHS
jgi:H/ACA ribonucleoprotein complex subunit 4